MTTQSWISVEDELPEEGILCIVCITGPGPIDWKFAIMWRYEGCCWQCSRMRIEDKNYIDGVDDRVTHWIPIHVPPPPIKA